MCSLHNRRLSWLPLIVLVVIAAQWRAVGGQCVTSDDCISDGGFSRCDSATGQCDCTFARHQHGFFCDKVCTDNGLRGHCGHGTCAYEADNFFLAFGECACDPGYVHDNSGLCTQAVCTEPCQNGGACIATDQCQCAAGFTGAQCQAKLQCEMLGAPLRGTTSVMMQNGIQHQTFDCNPGYAINGSRISICQRNQWQPALPPTCVDLDECLTQQKDTCDRQCGACVNTPGSFECAPPSNPNLVYDSTKKECCDSGETCDTTCFPHAPLTHGTIRYEPPLLNPISSKPLVLTTATVVCDSSRGFRLPEGAVTRATCARTGIFDATLTDCLPPSETTVDTTVDVDPNVETDSPPLPPVGDEVEQSRSGGDTALIASLISVTVVIILAVLLFVYFRARKPEHKYAVPPSLESPSPPPLSGKNSIDGGRGPPMHTQVPSYNAAVGTAAAASVAAAVVVRTSHKRGRTLVDPDNIYASPDTWNDTATVASTAPALTSSHLGVVETMAESQHYASCDLQPGEEEDPYEDACSSISPTKAATLPASPNQSAAAQFISGDVKQADTLPMMSPSRASVATTAAAIAAAAAVRKSRPSVAKLSMTSQMPQPPKAQRPVVLSKQQSSVRQAASLNSDSEYENPSNPASPPSSPPALTGTSSSRSHMAVIHSFQQHVQQQPLRPQSTSPPAIVSDSSTSSMKSSSPPTPENEIIPAQSSARSKSQKPPRPPRAPPVLPDLDSLQFEHSRGNAEQSMPGDKVAPVVPTRPQIQDSGRKPYKPMQLPPQATSMTTVVAATMATEAEKTSPLLERAPSGDETDGGGDPRHGQTTQDNSPAQLTSDPEGTEAEKTPATGAERTPAKKTPPQLPSKLNRLKLDETTDTSETTKPNLAPRPHVNTISASKSFDSEDGYLSPTDDASATSPLTTSSKPTPPPKRRPKASAQQQQDAVVDDMIVAQPEKSPSAKPTPPPKRGRPALVDGSTAGDDVDGDQAKPSVALKTSTSSSSSSSSAEGKPHLPPPRTASMPRFPSPLPSMSPDRHAKH